MFLLKLCQNSDCRNLWSSAFLFEHLLLLLLGMSCEAENKKKQNIYQGIDYSLILF